MRQRGFIEEVSRDTGAGTIRGDDGTRYRFGVHDWQGGDAPLVRTVVTFTPDGQNARDVRVALGLDLGDLSALRRVPLRWFYFSFKGRIGRKSYWFLFFLPVIGISFIMGSIAGPFDLGNPVYIAWFVFAKLLLWPQLAIMAKRLHDLGVSAWFLAIVFFIVVTPGLGRELINLRWGIPLLPRVRFAPS